MTPIQTTPRPGTSVPKPISRLAFTPIVTRSERVECTCPDHCDRDHEQD